MRQTVVDDVTLPGFQYVDNGSLLDVGQDTAEGFVQVQLINAQHSRQHRLIGLRLLLAVGLDDPTGDGLIKANILRDAGVSAGQRTFNDVLIAAFRHAMGFGHLGDGRGECAIA